jgi:redox-sensitive bicupin YhaK (pirin superfamily)
VARGKVTANGEVLDAGDALKLTDTPALSLADGSGAEVLVFDLPA